MTKPPRKPGSGGKRAGAGRKSMYGEPVTVITVKCPSSKVAELKNTIQYALSEWKVTTSSKLTKN